MRKFFALATLALAGCVSQPAIERSAPRYDRATLEVRTSTGQSMSGQFGVVAVDGVGGPLEFAHWTQIGPGRHEISVRCPEWAADRKAHTIAFTFAASLRYRLFCGNEPYIEAAR